MFNLKQGYEMSKDDIIEILKTHEQVLHLPKGMRKNSLTYGIIKHNYEKIAEEILAREQEAKQVTKK
jgi:hypothetical protein